MPVGKNERHRTERIGWLRAALLGANDGILSTSSLSARSGSLTCHSPQRPGCWGGRAGGRGDVYGCWRIRACPLTDADTEEAELELERGELKADDKGEH